MANREKVINYLESEIARAEQSVNDIWLECVEVKLLRDALAMLKEQDIVRCKDCKHRPIKPKDFENGFDLEFPDGKCPCQCDDGWYSWYPPDDWFCADGERRTEDD